MKKLLYALMGVCLLLAGCKKDDPKNIIVGVNYRVISHTSISGEDWLSRLFPGMTDNVIFRLNEDNSGVMVLGNGVYYDPQIYCDNWNYDEEAYYYPDNYNYDMPLIGYSFGWKYSGRYIQMNFNILPEDTAGSIGTLLYHMSSSKFSVDRDHGLRISRDEGVTIQNNSCITELVKE